MYFLYFQTSQGCYKACCQLASQQLQDLVRKLFLNRSSSDVSISSKSYNHTNKEYSELKTGKDWCIELRQLDTNVYNA